MTALQETPVTTPTASTSTTSTATTSTATASTATASTATASTATASTAGPPEGRARSRAAGYAITAGPPLLVLAVFVSAWYAVSYLVLSDRRQFLLPPLHQVIDVGMLDWANLSEILQGLKATSLVALSGFAIAIVIGSTFAVLMSQARWLERSFYPYAVMLQTLPILAMTPLVGLWFGFGLTSRIMICSILALFPIITSTLFGLQSVEPSQRDLFTLMKVGRLERLWRLELPSALPSILTGLRTSGGLAVIGAIVADFFFRQGTPGIGRLLDVYRTSLETERLYAALFFSSMLGLVLFLINTLITNRVLRHWHASAQH
jgi:NitT/TauT family transport system permease protein